MAGFHLRIGRVLPMTAALVACFAALPASAQTTPSNVVERFVAAVQSGADFKTGEFAAVVRPDDAARLATLAKCVPGPPRTSDSDSAIMVMWDCTDVPGGHSAAAIFDVQNGKITSLYTMPATVVRTRAEQ